VDNESSSLLSDRVDVNILMMMLLVNDEYDVLPELYEIFGEDKLIKFLDVFSGITIKVPDRSRLMECVEMIESYQILYKTTEETEERVTEDLAIKYEVSVEKIGQWYDRVEKIIKKTGNILHKK